MADQELFGRLFQHHVLRCRIGCQLRPSLVSEGRNLYRSHSWQIIARSGPQITDYFGRDHAFTFDELAYQQFRFVRYRICD
jgi:hypothetical protein